jgi:sulfite exporter TauE/SafE
MNYLQALIDQSSWPLITAFLLGLLTAVSPCPLATNITALAFISKDMDNKRQVFVNGLLYTVGRIVSYSIIGLVILAGASKFQISRAVQLNGEKWIGPLLIVIGVFMLGIVKLPGTNGSFLQKIADHIKPGRKWSAFALGLLFALAFCPYSGVLFFGMLMPMVLAQSYGMALIPVFAIATALPVILLAYLIAFSVNNISSVYSRITKVEKWFRRGVALLFIATGAYFVWIYFV